MFFFFVAGCIEKKLMSSFEKKYILGFRSEDRKQDVKQLVQLHDSKAQK
jgi:hypothetical protein